MSIPWKMQHPRRFTAAVGRSTLLLMRPAEDCHWWLHRSEKDRGHPCAKLAGDLTADQAKAAAEAVARDRWPDLFTPAGG